MSWAWFRKKPDPPPAPDPNVPAEIQAQAQEIGRAIAAMIQRLHHGHEQIQQFITRHPDANDEPLNAALQAAFERAVETLKPRDPFAFEFLDELYHRVTNSPPCPGGTRLEG